VRTLLPACARMPRDGTDAHARHKICDVPSPGAGGLEREHSAQSAGALLRHLQVQRINGRSASDGIVGVK